MKALDISNYELEPEVSHWSRTSTIYSW